MSVPWEFVGQLVLYSLHYWWAALAGVVVGFVAGAIPGLSPSNTIIMLLPLTLVLGPDAGLIFMVCIYISAQVGNSVPAILINIPGTGGAAATTLDGYPMAVQGKATQALVLSFVASILGGVVATLLTLALLPYLGRMGLYMRSVEMVAVMMLGLTLIAVIGTRDILKALIAGFLGLLMGAIGTDAIYSQPRATFGFLELYDGVPIVPALIGLFAISEVLNLIERERVVQAQGDQPVRLSARWVDIADGLRTSLRHWWEIVRAALVGLVIGIIPGAGADIASFVAYQQARTFSRYPHRFGTGVPEGVLAPESANNGVTSGAMVPLLALGVPGGLTTAVMLVALEYQGVQLGPRLFMERPLLAYGIFVSMLLGYVLIVLTLLPLTRYMARLTLVPSRYLGPIILFFCMVGSFAPRAMLFDMVLAVVLGLVGYVARRTGYPVASMVVGFILGPLFERYLTRSLRLAGGNVLVLFSSPLADVLWAMAVLALVIPYLRERRERQAAATPAATTPAA
ncbi:MAG TPA: tripartite tricarboxylate transporter permease [Limnochordales bacterium]